MDISSTLTHQALALLAVLHPCVAAAVGEQAVLVQALAAQAGVALGAAEQVSVGVVAVAHHSTAHHLAGLRAEHNQTLTRRRHQTVPCAKDKANLCNRVIKHTCAR